MRIYRVGYWSDVSGSEGFSYHSSRKEAVKASNRDYDPNSTAEVEQIDFKLTRAGVLSLLSRVASHPDNG